LGESEDVTVAIDIVIVNWNAGRQLRECLASIAATQREGFTVKRVVVVDNASRDGSTAGLGDVALPLTIMHNPVNLGFAEACNIGARDSTAEYVLFLNPDTRLFADSLSKPLAFMEHPKNQGTGIVGIQLLDANGQVSRNCVQFPTPGRIFFKSLGLDRLFPRLFPNYVMTTWDHGESRQVDHVIGAFFLVRRFLFASLKGFDTRFFVYLEDLDFSLRASQAGWSSFYLAEAQAYHRGGGTSEQVKATRLFYVLRSRILYGYKHFPWTAATGLLLTTLLLEPLVRLGFALTKGAVTEVRETLQAYCLLWSTFPAWVSKCY
jgi:GT2 family glycosyltransferase